MRTNDSGRTRGRWGRRIALSLSTILASGFAAPSLAQSAPPLRVEVDENGVDLVSGGYVTALTEGAIGTGEGRVALTRARNGLSNWVDNWSGGLMLQTVAGATTAYVITGSTAEAFSLSGSSFTALKGNGATLVANTGPNFMTGYLYTAPDGTKIQFRSNGVGAAGSSYPVEGFSCTGYSNYSCSIPVSITKPDGLVFTISYTFSNKCTSGSGPSCTGGKAFYRFSGVRSSAGYGFNVRYQTDLPGNFSVPQTAWYQKTGADFFNDVQPLASPATVTYANPAQAFSDYTDPAGRTWHFTAGNSQPLQGIQRPGAASNSTTIAYSGSPSYVSSITIDGVTTSYSRAVAGSVATTTVTDALSNQKIVEADLAKGRVIKITQVMASGNLITRFDHDTKGRVTEVSYPEGNKVQYAYDGRGNVTKTTLKAKPSVGGADIVTSAVYDTNCGNVATCNSPNWTLDADLNRTDYAYDPATGQPTSVTAPAATPGGVRPQTRYNYASTAGVSVLTGISNCITLASCSGTADEVKTSILYNGNLLPVSVSKGAGDASLTATQTATYDGKGNIATLDGPLPGSDDTTTYRYDAANNLVGMISPDPDGANPLKRRAVKLTFNADDQPTLIEIGTVGGTSDTDWSAFVSTLQSASTYDANGFKTKDIVTAGGIAYRATQYSYDALGRPDCTALRMNDATWTSLPASACTLGVAGSAGPDRITKTSYDTRGNAVKSQSAYGTSDQGDDGIALYTGNGRLASLSDGQGNSTTYEYDGFDRLAKTRYPVATAGAGASSTTDYELLEYDAVGNVLVRQLRDRQRIGYGYDLLGRLTTKNLPGSEPDVTYSYDLLGRMTGASQSGNALSFGYDALDRITSTSGPLGMVASKYDLSGRRTRLAWPDNFYVTFDHLVTGETSAILESGSLPLASFSYDDLGQRTQLVRGNGTVTSYGYDPALRLSTLAQDMPGGASDVTQSFGYSPAGQAVSRVRDNDAYAWMGAANASKAYAINGLNQISAINGTGVSHDVRGNLTGMGSETFGYSSENLLTSASVGGLGANLSYDPLLRLYQSASGVTSRLQYDGQDMIAEYDGANSLRKRFVFGPAGDEPLVELDAAGNKTYLHADEHGSIVARTDGSGAATINSYDEYGVPAASNGGRFQYTGQASMPELGLSYYKARFYSPTLGRFLQTDPIGYGDGLNHYAYVGNDPINRHDPTGQKCEVDDEGNANEDCNISVTGKKLRAASIAALHLGGLAAAGAAAGEAARKVPCRGGLNVQRDPSDPNHITISGSVFSALGNRAAELGRFVDRVNRVWSGQVGRYTLTSALTVDHIGRGNLMVTLSPATLGANTWGPTWLNARIWGGNLERSAGHEVGHVLGEQDRYHKDANGFTVADAGYGNSLMADFGPLREDMVSDILARCGA